MVTILCRNNAIMEVTAFFPGGSKVENDNMRVDKIMICLDCMVNRQISGPSGPAPFWLFKPFIFEAFPFASKEQSPLFHEAYTMMMEVSKREKAFGESKPLEHMNKNRPWKHNMLVTWIKLKEDMTVEEQMKLFLEDFKKTILIKQCQVNFHLAAQMKFPKSMTDLMMPLDLIEKRSLNNSLWANMHCALNKPKLRVSNRLHERFTDDDITKMIPSFFPDENVPKKMFWHPELVKFVEHNAE